MRNLREGRAKPLSIWKLIDEHNLKRGFPNFRKSQYNCHKQHGNCLNRKLCLKILNIGSKTHFFKKQQHISYTTSIWNFVPILENKKLCRAEDTLEGKYFVKKEFNDFKWNKNSSSAKKT